MSDSQIFQIWGLLYLAVGVGMIINSAFYKKLMAEFSENPPSIYLGGLAALVIGFLIVTFHNTWTGDWSVIITIFGWLALLKGVFLLLLPRVSIKIYKFFEGQMTKYAHAWAVIMALVGIILIWLGFSVA
ncbi:MAG: hypothetical protein JW947_01365 [Sedimentisphaerales bacterium]|nr:hypothetical protein [Sedimentisphaerales bacterium]